MIKRQSSSKIISDISLLKNAPHPIVFTNGCFDILHAGHVDYLEKASAYGATLIVGVNSDESVRLQNKAPDRPMNTSKHRQIVLSALECVDYVIEFSDETPQSLIESILPDVLIKGGDWEIDNIAGAKAVQNNGGEVHTIDFIHDTSTTALINKIRK